jgi:hypothetical protein
MIFRVVMNTYNHYHSEFQTLTLKRDPGLLTTALPSAGISSLPQATANLSVSIDFLILDIYINEITYYVVFPDWFLSLGINVFKTHPYCRMHQYLIPFMAK